MNIYQTKYLTKRGLPYALAALSWVYDCDHCEYVMTALTKEGAQTIEHAHLVSAHPQLLVERNWRDSPLSAL